MKPGKVLCSTFLFPISEVDPVKTLEKYKRLLCVPIQLTNSTDCDHDAIYAQSMSTQKKMYRVKDFPT